MIVYYPSYRWFTEWLRGEKAGYFYDFAMDIMTGSVMAALYHEKPVNCPTWTDHAECRCMVEPL